VCGPRGWGTASSDANRIARLATQTGLFPVFEAESGDIMSATKIRRQAPVEEYLRPQRRYAHLFKPEVRHDVIARIQARADRNIARFGLLDGEEKEA
jgi:pyruvate ferredoxin oxidoreductase beta subunit